MRTIHECFSLFTLALLLKTHSYAGIPRGKRSSKHSEQGYF